MKKNELKAICDKYDMEILREPITGEAHGLRLITAADIPELDALCDCEPYDNVSATKEYGVYQATEGKHLYTVYCPTNWFDLHGWV